MSGCSHVHASTNRTKTARRVHASPRQGQRGRQRLAALSADLAHRGGKRLVARARARPVRGGQWRRSTGLGGETRAVLVLDSDFIWLTW